MTGRERGKQAQAQLAEIQRRNGELILERDQARAEHAAYTQQADAERANLLNQIDVLRSDRDRLTVALEVCTRRLASPGADSDPSRAGWRAANRQDQAQTPSSATSRP